VLTFRFYLTMIKALSTRKKSLFKTS